MEKQPHYPESLLDERKDPVGLICLGRGGRFEDTACPYYSRGTGECGLLLGRGIAGVFEFGRCLNETELLVRQQRILKTFKLEHEGFPVHDFLHGSSAEDRGASYTGLLQARPQAHNIILLYEYVNKALYSYAKRILRMRKLIADRRRCGNCTHLPASSPRMCQLREIRGFENPRFGLLQHAHDSICEGYEPLRTFLNPIADIGRTVDREERTGNRTYEIAADGWDDRSLALLDVQRIFNLMMKCVRKAPTPKRREMEIRRLEDVNFLYGCLLREQSLEAAKKLLLDQKANSTKEREAARRRLDRDLEAVGGCLSHPKSCH